MFKVEFAKDNEKKLMTWLNVLSRMIQEGFFGLYSYSHLSSKCLWGKIGQPTWNDYEEIAIFHPVYLTSCFCHFISSSHPQ